MGRCLSSWLKARSSFLKSQTTKDTKEYEEVSFVHLRARRGYRMAHRSLLIAHRSNYNPTIPGGTNA
jgi:hypothetical protein